jgi:hypothetical protein
MEENTVGTSDLEKGCSTELYVGDRGWGEGGGEMRACRIWKTSATGKAHMKLNRKKNRKLRT